MLHGKGDIQCPKCQRKFRSAAGADVHLREKHGLMIVQSRKPLAYMKGYVPAYDNALVEVPK